MALNKGESSSRNVTSMAQARQERLDKSTIAYGRRQADTSDGPNLQAKLEQINSKPNVRPVSANRPTGRRFDKEKVNRIKELLAQGKYEIDSLKVADLFIEHERHS